MKFWFRWVWGDMASWELSFLFVCVVLWCVTGETLCVWAVHGCLLLLLATRLYVNSILQCQGGIRPVCPPHPLPVGDCAAASTTTDSRTPLPNLPRKTKSRARAASCEPSSWSSGKGTSWTWGMAIFKTRSARETGECEACTQASVGLAALSCFPNLSHQSLPCACPYTISAGSKKSPLREQSCWKSGTATPNLSPSRTRKRCSPKP